MHGTHDIASLVLCFLAPISSLVGNNEIGWKNAGSFRQDLLSLEEVGPLLREQLVLHHLTGLLASSADASKERGEGSLFVYMYIHISWREKTRKKGSEKRLLILYSLLGVLKYTINLSAYAVFKAEARRVYTLAADADNETVLTSFLDSTQRAALPTVKFIS